MTIRQYTAVSAINLAFLLLGFLIGKEFYIPKVQAQASSPQNSSPPVEEISPIMTVGSAGIGTLLVGRLAADEINVKGFDPIKFDQNLLNLLNNKPLFFSHQELQGVVDASKSDKILRMNAPARPSAQTPPEKKP